MSPSSRLNYTTAQNIHFHISFESFICFLRLCHWHLEEYMVCNSIHTFFCVSSPNDPLMRFSEVMQRAYNSHLLVPAVTCNGSGERTSYYWNSEPLMVLYPDRNDNLCSDNSFILSVNMYIYTSRLKVFNWSV